LKISTYITSTWTSLGTTWKNKGLMSKHIRVLFLSPLTFTHLKKIWKTYFPTYPNIRWLWKLSNLIYF
jgi:hypothetical protein